jgi:hypothetical protein
MCTEAARVHYALGDAFMVEMEDLLPQVEVLQYGRAPGADSERILIVRDRHALLGREHGHIAASDLMGLAAPAPEHGLIIELSGFAAASACPCVLCHGRLRKEWGDLVSV